MFARIGEAVHHVAPHAKRIGVDLMEVDVRSLGRLQHELGDRAILAADGVFDDLRAVKDQDEIEQLRLACELTEHGIDESAKQLHIGQSALAVNSAYHIAVHQSAIAKPRFSQFRQSGGNATLGLGITDSGPVTAGRTVKFDMEVDVGGYHSDLGRTYVIEPTVDQIAVYDALRHALHDMISAVEPGITFDRLFAIGSEAMYQAGFSNYSRGHLGHSDGLTRHFEESPFIAPGEHRPLVPNMVLSLELPYYLYGVGAFQLERMVLVTEDGYDIMDSLPFTLAVEH